MVAVWRTGLVGLRSDDYVAAGEDVVACCEGIQAGAWGVGVDGDPWVCDGLSGGLGFARLLADGMVRGRHRAGEVVESGGYGSVDVVDC